MHITPLLMKSQTPSNDETHLTLKSQARITRWVTRQPRIHLCTRVEARARASTYDGWKLFATTIRCNALNGPPTFASYVVFEVAPVKESRHLKSANHPVSSLLSGCLMTSSLVTGSSPRAQMILFWYCNGLHYATDTLLSYRRGDGRESAPPKKARGSGECLHSILSFFMNLTSLWISS